MQIVAEYGLIQLTENADIVNETIRKSNGLYNSLADIVQAGRRRLKRAEQKIPALAECHIKIDEIDTRINALFAQKRQSRSHSAPTVAPTKQEIAAAKAERKAAYAELDATRKLFSDQLQPISDELYNEYGIGERGGKYMWRAQRAMKEHDVYWGTYLKIFASIRQACKAKTQPFMKDGRPRKITPWVERPKKRTGRRLEDGLVAVHIQNRVLRTEGLFGTDPFIRIDPLPANAFDPSVPRCQRKKLQRTMLHLRVGSDGRKPIWATWPLFMHRPLPPGAKVLWAVVTRTLREQRFRYEWKLQLTLEVNDTPPKLTGESVAINLGWRRMHGEPLLGKIPQVPQGPTQDGELRAATWADTAGETGEVRLGASFRGRIRKSWGLRSIRDMTMDELRAQLVALGVPCQKWKSPARFYRLLRDEIDRGASPQYAPQVTALLRPWVYHDKHLYWYERGCREGALNYRRDVYRRFAIFCAKRYKAIVVETYDIRDISENADMPKGPGVQRVESAPSVTRQILRSTGARLGCTIIEGDSDLATQKCYLCGCEEPWNAAARVKHTCVACQNEWDQDQNNALNMLARAEVMLKTMDPLAVRKPKRDAAFSKRHKKHDDENDE